MATCRKTRCLFAGSLSVAVIFGATTALCAQVFVVGEKTAMADVSTEFHPTKIELPSKPIGERGRRELVRDLEAEQGFAHRALPLATELTLIANGNLTPGGDDYKQLLFKKGESAAPGDRVAITTVTVKGDRILFDINGGPYVKHRILRHIELNDVPVVVNDGSQVTGFRVALVFEGGIPDISAPEVKALLDPIIDFGVKSSGHAYADTLPPFLKQAVAQHDVLVGMNRKLVVAAMGAPDSKVRELVPGSDTRHYEEWIYGRVPQTVRFVRFEGDRVTQVKVAALGQPIAVRTENEMQGFLDPEETHELAMGDSKPANRSADGEARAAPPSLRKPGEPLPPGSSQSVLYPVATKAQPLPAAPGSPADPSAGADPPTSAPGAPSRASSIPTPGEISGATHFTDVQATEGRATEAPGTRVN
jgi:hypothetical protein